MARRRIILTVVIVGGAFLALIAGVGAMWIKAPHLPRLLMEGYPEPRWPAAGYFAPVAGNAPAAPFAAMGAPSDWLTQLFADSGGKALLVHQGTRLQVALYAEDVPPETRFNSYSLVKSLVGALLLKAVSDGKIADLDEPIGTYLPDIGDQTLRQVPLRAFAQMRSGVAADADDKISGSGEKDLETYRANPFGTLARLHTSGLQALAGELRTMPDRSGTYRYQNINTALLGAVLERVYDKPLQHVLAEKIWLPAGAAPADWRRYGAELPVSPYCCIYATAADWLRVGVFLARNGAGGVPFLPRPLWDAFFATELAAPERAVGNYGLHIRHDVLDRDGEPLQGPFSFMLGRGGQIVYMMPERDLVVVRFGEGNQLLHSTLYAVWRGLDLR